MMVNCSMVGNRASCTIDDPNRVGTLSTLYDLTLVNCLLDRSELVGSAAEIVSAGNSGNRVLAAINTVMRNDAADYQPFSLRSPEMGVSLANCAISRLDVDSLPQKANDYCYNVTAVPGPFSTTLEGPGGLLSRGVSGASPYCRAGRGVWEVNGRNFYFYDEVANPNRPWRDISHKDWYSGSVGGLTLESPLLPDAFGASRVPGRIAYGPLNAPAGGTFLLLR